MDLLKRKFSLVVLAIFYFYLERTCAQNLTLAVTPLKYHIPIIPIITTSIPGIQKFERIRVPVDPPKENSYEKKRPVQSEKRDEKIPERKVRVTTENPRRKQKHINDETGNLAVSYVNRLDEHGKIPVLPKPNEIQPLHISTFDYEAPSPNHTPETVKEKKNKFNEQEEKLRIKNLPENPERVPETNWWDNTAGKYNYGIIHDDIKAFDDVQTLGKDEIQAIDMSELESKEVAMPPVVMQPAVQHEAPPTSSVKFRSSFKDPGFQSQVQHRSDIPGKFLYKTQVYYPNYRDHIYLPITTYYGHHKGLAKIFPVFNTHTVDHNPPSHLTPPTPPPVPPVTVSRPHPNVIAHEEPRKSHDVAPKRHPPPLPPQKHTPPLRKPSVKPPPPPSPKEDAEDYDYEEEEGEGDDEEGEEEESDGGGKKKYEEEEEEEEGESVEGEAGEEGDDEEDGDEEEEEEESEERTPKYTYGSYSGRNSGESSEEDTFDKAWKKYGYHPKAQQSDENDSVESSESQLVPQRKKIVHMKMEYFTAPHQTSDSDYFVAEPSNAVKSVKDPKSETEAVDVNEDKRNRRKKKRKSKSGDKSQKQHPNAGPDDLKFFQYFNYFGNGEHKAGSRAGNDKHYIEQHERGSQKTGQFQKKIIWADKHGGYGQHYYDLNHGR